jgi:hypothetical protein
VRGCGGQGSECGRGREDGFDVGHGASPVVAGSLGESLLALYSGGWPLPILQMGEEIKSEALPGRFVLSSKRP